jgi:hypothetical protein
VTQLHRSPGVDFSVEIQTGERKLHSCWIIRSGLDRAQRHQEGTLGPIDQRASSPRRACARWRASQPRHHRAFCRKVKPWGQAPPAREGRRRDIVEETGEVPRVRRDHGAPSLRRRKRRSARSRTAPTCGTPDPEHAI